MNVKNRLLLLFDAAESAQKTLTLNGTDFQRRPMNINKAVAKTDDIRSRHSYRLTMVPGPDKRQ